MVENTSEGRDVALLLRGLSDTTLVNYQYAYGPYRCAGMTLTVPIYFHSHGIIPIPIITHSHFRFAQHLYPHSLPFLLPLLATTVTAMLKT